MDEYEWGHASVAYPDWHGTAQLDQKMTGNTGIYELTGVDSDEFLIIGLDIGGGESGMHDPHVIAVRKAELGNNHISDLSEIRAVNIKVHGVDPFELLRQITHLLDMRFRIRSVKDSNITITELLDSPEQED